jgi:hypothetical protein
MLSKSYIGLSIGIISLFTGVVYTLVNSTGTMITEQTEIMDDRYNGRIEDSEFQRRSRESEGVYRDSVANALERIESKFVEVAKLVKSLDDLMGGSDEPNVRLVDQEVNITSLGEDRYAVVFNGTPYDLEDLFLDVEENKTVTMKVVVIEQNNYYEYYPYLRGNMSDILNLSEDYNYSADLDQVAKNLSAGIESFRKDRIT